MKKILISVIVPVYNVEKYLDRCVKSIVNQTYQNLEVILVDDGSTDNSGKMCDDWAKKDERIIVMHKENGGVSSSRNVGIKASTGNYILFLDSDDFLAKDALLIMEKAVECYDVDLVIGNYKMCFEDGSKSDVTRLTENKLMSKEEFFDIAHEMLPVSGNKLCRKSIIDENKLEFLNIKVSEDLNFYLKFMFFCNKVFVTNEYIFNYCILEKSASKTYDDRYLNTFEAFEDLEKFIANYNKNEKFETLMARMKLIYFNMSLGLMVKCKDKDKRREMIKIFYQKTKKINKLRKQADHKCDDIYIKIKLKKLVMPIYVLFHKD